MSRINRARINAGDSVDATDLNARFNDYVQPGALDLANHAAASVDLPQVRGNDLITVNADRVVLGSGVWDHSVVQSIPSATVAPATLAEVGAGATRLTFGAGGWSLDPGDILRVYWDIGANPNITGRPYASPHVGTIPIDDGAGGNIDLNDCFACWVLHLQWDITSPALTAFGAVPGQNDYQAGTPSGSAYVYQQAGQTIVPAYQEFTSPGDAVNGAINSAPVQRDLKWQGVSGSYWTINQTGAPLVVYGLRIVAHGIYHTRHDATGNKLSLDTAVGGVNQYLELTQGQLTAIHQRTG